MQREDRPVEESGRDAKAVKGVACRTGGECVVDRAGDGFLRFAPAGPAAPLPQDLREVAVELAGVGRGGGRVEQRDGEAVGLSEVSGGGGDVGAEDVVLQVVAALDVVSMAGGAQVGP